LTGTSTIDRVGSQKENKNMPARRLWRRIHVEFRFLWWFARVSLTFKVCLHKTQKLSRTKQNWVVQHKLKGFSYFCTTQIWLYDKTICVLCM
jgi:hypothetical protein